MRRIHVVSALLAASALVACGGDDGTSGTNEPAPTVHRIDGAPEAAGQVDRVEVTTSMAPAVLSVVSGVVAVGTEDGLWVGSTIEEDALASLPVVPDDGGPDATGAVHEISRRAAGGVLLAADNGLFHDATGLLLLSPLSDTLAGEEIRTLDSVGTDAAEELWIVTASGLLHVGGGKLEAISLPGVSAIPDAAVAVGAAEAIVTAAGTAHLVRLDKSDALVLAGGLGAVHGFDRGDDGTVYLATDAGLFSRSKSGALTLRTFAAAGAKAVPTLAVTAAFGSTVAVVGGDLVAIDADGARALGPVVPAAAQGVAVDANGDTWAVDDKLLYRYRTGAPVSFVNDVSPFFAAHCATCHATGKEGSPKMDLESYDVASAKADLILKRLRGVDIAPMPPANVEVLTAADYAVVTRWVGGGKKP